MPQEHPVWASEIYRDFPEDRLQRQAARCISGNGRVEKPHALRAGAEFTLAAGDFRRGQSLVVWAIHEGRYVTPN